MLLAIGCHSYGSGFTPVIRITAPDDSSVVAGTVEINIEVIHDRKIKYVELSIDRVTTAILREMPFVYSWNAVPAGSSSFHVMQAHAFDVDGNRGSSPEISVIVRSSEEPGRLWLKRACLNGKILDIDDPRIDVAPAESVIGEIAVQAINPGNRKWGAPLTGTPNWGEHERIYWDTGIWLPPDTSTHSLSIDATVPLDTGRYYIILAWGYETDPANVLSLTYWRFPGGPVWNDGVDIADWTDDQVQMAIDSGFVESRYLYADSTYGQTRIPAAAIRIFVREDR